MSSIIQMHHSDVWSPIYYTKGPLKRFIYFELMVLYFLVNLVWRYVRLCLLRVCTFEIFECLCLFRVCIFKMLLCLCLWRVCVLIFYVVRVCSVSADKMQTTVVCGQGCLCPFNSGPLCPSVRLQINIQIGNKRFYYNKKSENLWWLRCSQGPFPVAIFDARHENKQHFWTFL